MKKNTTRTTTTRMATVAIAIAILAGAAPAIASAAAAMPVQTFTTQLAATPATVKFVAAASDTTALSTTSVKALAALPTKTTAVKTTATTTGTTATTTGTTATKTAPVKRAATSDELGRAKSILAGLTARYPVLQGTTVSFGDARGYQAIALYKSGRIIISATHTASLEQILNHEVWHIIDWRDNGQIDWGEQVPPK